MCVNPIVESEEIRVGIIVDWVRVDWIIVRVVIRRIGIIRIIGISIGAVIIDLGIGNRRSLTIAHRTIRAHITIVMAAYQKKNHYCENC